MFQRPQQEIYQYGDITKDSVDSALDVSTLPKVLGQQFCFRHDNIFFHVCAVEASLEGYRFTIQYENNEYVFTDLLSLLHSLSMPDSSSMLVWRN